MLRSVTSLLLTKGQVKPGSKSSCSHITNRVNLNLWDAPWHQLFTKIGLTRDCKLSSFGLFLAELCIGLIGNSLAFPCTATPCKHLLLRLVHYSDLAILVTCLFGLGFILSHLPMEDCVNFFSSIVAVGSITRETISLRYASFVHRTCSRRYVLK